MPIICLSHGSRHPEADACVAEIARATAELGGCPVYFAHLDFSPSTLTNVAHIVAASGATHATVSHCCSRTLFICAMMCRQPSPRRRLPLDCN